MEPFDNGRKVWKAAAAVAFLVLAGCAHRDTASSAGPASVVERLELLERKPAFGGTRFGDTGEYEQIVAIAHLKVDARHPANAAVVDLAAAADADGAVRLRTNLVVLRPRDGAKASGVLVFDVANRGRRLLLPFVNDGALQADAADQAGTGWAMRQGHALVWVGWQGDIPLASNAQTIGMALPVATDRGAPIVGTSIEEMVFDAPGGTGVIPLSYPAASTDAGKAELSVHARPGAAARVLPASAWTYKSTAEIEVQRPAEFDAGAIYEFRYPARDPRPFGLGMVAVRDLVGFLKRGAPDAQGQAHPLADIRTTTTIALGISQSGRFLRDYIWQGFNAAPSGGRVFDAAMPTIAGSRKSFTNARWAQPGRYSRQHEDHWFYGDQFPFSDATTTDPLTGRTDGIFARCRDSDTCPKLMHMDSSLEFWQARASLVVTDGAGHDVALPEDVRAYLMSSTQHAASDKPAAGICQVPNNPARQSATYRAVMTRLIEWARDAKAPSTSRYPSLAAGTLAAPQAGTMGFPDLGALASAPQFLPLSFHQ